MEKNKQRSLQKQFRIFYFFFLKDIFIEIQVEHSTYIKRLKSAQSKMFRINLDNFPTLRFRINFKLNRMP